MRTRLFFVLLFASLLPFRLLAWGYTGHQLVAEMAMHQLSDATLKNYKGKPEIVVEKEDQVKVQ